MGLVLRSSVETLQSDLQNSITLQAAASRLGIGRHAVLELIQRGLLPRTVRIDNGWRMPLASVETIEASCQSLPKASKYVYGISLRQATRQCGLSLGQLIEFIFNGKLTAWMAHPQKGLLGIVVARKELDSLAPKNRKTIRQKDAVKRSPSRKPKRAN